jgi:hypothetical protein
MLPEEATILLWARDCFLGLLEPTVTTTFLVGAVALHGRNLFGVFTVGGAVLLAVCAHAGADFARALFGSAGHYLPPKQVAEEL